MSQPRWIDVLSSRSDFPKELKNEVLTSTLNLLVSNKFIESEAIKDNTIAYQRRFHGMYPEDNAIKIELVKKDDYDYVLILMQKEPGHRSHCWIEFFKDTTVLKYEGPFFDEGKNINEKLEKMLLGKYNYFFDEALLPDKFKTLLEFMMKKYFKERKIYPKPKLYFESKPSASLTPTVSIDYPGGGDFNRISIKPNDKSDENYEILILNDDEIQRQGEISFDGQKYIDHDCRNLLNTLIPLTWKSTRSEETMSKIMSTRAYTISQYFLEKGFQEKNINNTTNIYRTARGYETDYYEVQFKLENTALFYDSLRLRFEKSDFYSDLKISGIQLFYGTTIKKEEIIDPSSNESILPVLEKLCMYPRTLRDKYQDAIKKLDAVLEDMFGR